MLKKLPFNWILDFNILDETFVPNETLELLLASSKFSLYSACCYITHQMTMINAYTKITLTHIKGALTGGWFLKYAVDSVSFWYKTSLDGNRRT